MSISVSVNIGAFQSAVQCCLPTPVPYSKTFLQSRTSALAIPSLTTQVSKGVVGGKFSKSIAIDKTGQHTQNQPIIDILRSCVEQGSIREAKAVHGFVLKSGFGDEDLLVILNHIANVYSKCSDFSAACGVFSGMSDRNIYSWTVMIVGSTENGYFLDGFKFYCEMKTHGILPDAFAYSAIIQSCIGLDCVEYGKMVHAQIIVTGFASHSFVGTSLLNMYAKLGKIEDACRVFNALKERNRVSWNAILSGLTSNGLYVKAFDKFLEMKKEGFTPNIYTFTSVLKAVGKLGDVVRGRELHSYVSELGMESNIHAGTALIDMYSKCGSINDARSIFDMNFTCCKINTPWNAMISGYLQCGYNREALKFYVRMCQTDVKSDLYTYCSVFNAIAAVKCSQFVRAVHGMVFKSEFDLTATSINNAIADAYSKCGSLKDVKKVFDKMEDRDVVSWTTLVNAYSQSSEAAEALTIFSLMREEGFMPNQFTFASVLAACASLCFLEYGQQVHGLLYKASLNTEKCMESALVDMYGKCGSITEAANVFAKISGPDVVSWTAMISVYAQHGFVEEAFHLFQRMENLGIKANAVTLLCVLFACSHGGMVEEGLHYFQVMKERYGVVPEMEHYACIVDLLGRVGRLDDAIKFVKNMPIEPNEVVWQSLLGACRVHGNIELGEIAAREIFSISPEFSATYVLLSNAYIETGNLEDGLSLRSVMKKRGVRKEPGYSWITVKGRQHRFISGDQHHPQKNEIYAKLEELKEKIKVKGYTPDLRYAWKDVD